MTKKPEFLFLSFFIFSLFTPVLGEAYAQVPSSPKLAQVNTAPPNPPQKVIKILSIDGGGIRGLIPALVLKNLESRLKGKHITECFDIISGNSTGGIIALLLNTPGAEGKPKYTASKILELYETLGSQVFQRSLWQRFRTGWG